MYPITSSVLDKFERGSRQYVDITFYGTNENLNISQDDIKSNSLSINRYSVSGSSVELGSAVAAELKMTLDNTDGRYNDVVFEGARLFVRVGVRENPDDEESNVNYIPMGYFTIDEVPRIQREIAIAALDDMVLFDKEVDFDLLTFPMTISQMVSQVCSICNVRLLTNISLLPNGTYSMSRFAEVPQTYRQLIQWAASATGTCAFIDWDGYLVFKWYDQQSLVLDETNRYLSDFDENLLTVSGVTIATKDAEYTAGTEDYPIVIEGNGLIPPSAINTFADNIYSANGDLEYLPFSAEIAPMPHIWPLDKVWFVSRSHGKVSAIVTEVTFKLNGNVSLQGVGESATRKGYASLDPLTARERFIINALTAEQDEFLSGRIQDVLAFNELISNALGLYVTPVTQSDGSVVYYMHNAPTLEESSIIFTMTAGGIAWTTSGWNGGSPVWSSGVTAAGDALFRLLSAEGINVAQVGQDYNIEITPSAFRIYYHNMLVTNIAADEMTIPKAQFTDYAECGKVRLVPYGTTGTNLVFVD